MACGERRQRPPGRLRGVEQPDPPREQLEPALVDLREREQVVDRAAHPVDFLAHALEHVALGGRERAAAQIDIELGAHDGQRRAQLVGRVGDEPLLLGDALLEAVEHRVQGHGEVTDLVGRPRHGDPFVQVVDPDLLGLRRHPVDRQERLAREHPAAERGRRERRRDGEEKQHQDPLDRAPDLIQRLGDHDHVALPEARDGRHQHPVLLAVGAQREGQHARASGQRILPHAGGGDPVAADVGVGPADEHPATLVEDLGGGVARQQHAARVLEILEPLLRVVGRDRLPAAAQIPIDRRLHVGAQLQQHEGAENDDDRGQQRHVPGGEPDADRESHRGSSTKPLPRTVRIRPRPSFLRR